MIGSETEVYNLALNAIGARSNITSPSENSREAEVCRLWYSVVRDHVLSAANWPEATKFRYLSLISDFEGEDTWSSGYALPGYRFAYAYPTDALRPQHIRDTYGRFEVSTGGSNQMFVNTNAEDAILVYTYRNELTSQWSSGLGMAIVYGLAAHICMPLTGKPQRANLMLQQANTLILSARETAANTNVAQVETIPDWLQARGYNNSSPGVRYVYPYGNLLAVPSL